MTATLRPRWSAQRDLDQVFDHFFGNGRESAGYYAPATLWEEEGRWCVEIDLPGIRQEDIDITLEKNTLHLTAERKAPQQDLKFWHQERTFGKVERVVKLPETVNPEGIEAELKDGVLRLHLAKRPELQPKKIQVKGN